MNGIPAFWTALICSNLWGASGSEYGFILSIGWMALVVLILVEECRAIRKGG